ncbi:maleate isomerase [Rhizobium sp. PP-F2F-G48]|uniref:maleate cis-trans isomerase family protein n=1 Tax=Rhizobium sp. PP-F2F-G48 TaxID=2135651 RepID=UPI001043E49B|nr:hypothetical protein [Rhizobium sp. PP-F2F-G48]TCM46516.1 maleate isomerase [Rhizobium sp. PP-F2F-G48]
MTYSLRPDTRIGVILPSVNTVVEPLFAKSVPANVSVHTSRMLLSNSLSPEMVRRMDETDGVAAARQIASCRPSSVAYCCAASSLVQGREYDRHLRQELEAICGTAATTGAYAIECALNYLSVNRLCVVSPYPKQIDELEHQYFRECEFEVVGSSCLGITDSFSLAAPSAETLMDLARTAWTSDAQALVITCLNTYSHEVIHQLEAELGVPVVTATLATLWHALKLSDVDVTDMPFGSLFQAKTATETGEILR